MKKFWTQAVQVLRPGGTVAIWTKGIFYARMFPILSPYKKFESNYPQTRTCRTLSR